MSQTRPKTRRDVGDKVVGFHDRPVVILITVVIIVIILIALLLPQGQIASTPNRRLVCRRNLIQIGIALNNYHDEYGSFPPAYIADENGKPMHSWRVLILPFIEQQELYEQYRFDEPWNGPHNSQLAERVVELFYCPNLHDRERQEPADQIDPTMTSYMVLLGEKCAFNGPKVISLEKISDEKTSTLLLVETIGESVHWMKPQDIQRDDFFRQLSELEDKHFSHAEGTHVLFADGRLRFISRNIKRKTLHALSTVNGGETVEDY